MGKRQLLWYLAQRIIALFVVLFLIASFDFISFRAIAEHSFLPRTSDPQLIDLLTRTYHLDSSLPEQYLWYMWDTLTLDFGISTSYWKGAHINEFAIPHLERSLWLFAIVGILTILIGIAYEASVSCLKTRVLRMTMRLIALGLICVPSMGLTLLALDLNLRLDIGLPWYAGPYNPDIHGGEGMLDRVLFNVTHGFLPVVICILVTFGFISLFFRRQAGTGLSLTGIKQELVEILGAMRANPWPTKFYFAWIASCALVIDVLFNYHGLGTLLWHSLWSRDLPVSMAVFLIIAVILAILNFSFDVLCAVVPGATVPSPRSELGIVGAAPQAAPSLLSSANNVWTEYRKSKAGLSALVVFAAIVIAALTAPLLATVENPENPNTYEPQVPEDDWRNPLPPSLSPSPYTGYRHPLGTDQKGVDIYSAMLYGSRMAVLACVTIGFLSFALGLLSGLIGASLPLNGRWPIKGVSWLANTIGDTFVAIPLLIVVMGPTVQLGWDYWVILVLIAPLIFLWASVSVAQQVRRKAIASRTAANWERPPIRDIVPTIVARALYITKLSVVTGLLTIFMMEFLGLVYVSSWSWGSLLEGAYERDAFAIGAWWWYTPPIVGISILAMSSFVAVDTLERIVRKKEDATLAAVAQLRSVTTV